MIRGRGAVDRRLSQLEAKQGPPPSTWDVIDPILGELSMSDLIALVQRDDNLKRGLRPTARQDAVYAAVRDRLTSVGIVLP